MLILTIKILGERKAFGSLRSRLVVGLGGATCSGKTTLARALAAAFPNARYLSQDDHYLPTDDPRHTWVKELRHVNWELVTAFDMDALDRAIREEKAVVASAASASVEERARLSAAASASEDMDALKKVLAQCQVKKKKNPLSWPLSCA